MTKIEILNTIVKSLTALLSLAEVIRSIWRGE
jgi:hypothetical protein